MPLAASPAVKKEKRLGAPPSASPPPTPDAKVGSSNAALTTADNSSTLPLWIGGGVFGALVVLVGGACAIMRRQKQSKGKHASASAQGTKLAVRAAPQRASEIHQKLYLLPVSTGTRGTQSGDGDALEPHDNDHTHKLDADQHYNGRGSIMAEQSGKREDDTEEISDQLSSNGAEAREMLSPARPPPPAKLLPPPSLLPGAPAADEPPSAMAAVADLTIRLKMAASAFLALPKAPPPVDDLPAGNLPAGDLPADNSPADDLLASGSPADDLPGAVVGATSSPVVVTVEDDEVGPVVVTVGQGEVVGATSSPVVVMVDEGEVEHRESTVFLVVAPQSSVGSGGHSRSPRLSASTASAAEHDEVAPELTPPVAYADMLTEGGDGAVMTQDMPSSGSHGRRVQVHDDRDASNTARMAHHTDDGASNKITRSFSQHIKVVMSARRLLAPSVGLASVGSSGDGAHRGGGVCGSSSMSARAAYESRRSHLEDHEFVSEEDQSPIRTQRSTSRRAGSRDALFSSRKGAASARVTAPGTARGGATPHTNRGGATTERSGSGARRGSVEAPPRPPRERVQQV